MNIKLPNIGDYVVATKYADGDPMDQWCVGFFNNTLGSHPTQRYLVVDTNGEQFRAAGFRRIQKISANRGKFLVDNSKHIEFSGKSIWYFVRTKMEVYSNGKEDNLLNC